MQKTLTRLLGRRAITAVMATSAVAALACASAAPAGATPASATLTAGSLAFVTAPPSVGFTATTLNGADQSTTATQPIDVGDATGSGAGWNITATSTTFTSGSHTLPTAATTVPAAPSDVCDTGATCTTATNGVSYPFALPAAGTAPTATKLVSGAAGTGMGNQTVTPTWKLAIPANAYSGLYTSTWTLSLVSGP